MKSKTLENIILTVTSLISAKTGNVLAMGKELLEAEADDLTDGGFWIWNIENNQEFYSPNFRKSLGFEGEHDFPSVSESWQKQILKEDLEIAIKNFKKSYKKPEKHPYYQEVSYYRKDGSVLRVICSGLIIKRNGKSKYLVGTHKLI